jgi:hypothetical protein
MTMSVHEINGILCHVERSETSRCIAKYCGERQRGSIASVSMTMSIDAAEEMLPFGQHDKVSSMKSLRVIALLNEVKLLTVAAKKCID